MQISDIQQAKSDLANLIEHAMKGEEVILSQNGCPMVRLVQIEPDDEPRRGGNGKVKSGLPMILTICRKMLQKLSV